MRLLMKDSISLGELNGRISFHSFHRFPFWHRYRKGIFIMNNHNFPGKHSAYKEIGNDAYSYKQCIRTWVPSLGWVFNVTKYSKTTSRHQSVSMLYYRGDWDPSRFDQNIRVIFDQNIIVTQEMLAEAAFKSENLYINRILETTEFKSDNLYLNKIT